MLIFFNRIDKYLLLQRRFVNAGFRLLSKHNWDSDVVSGVRRIFQEGPFHPTSSKVSDAIRYHIIDLFFVELKKALPFDGPAYQLHLALMPIMDFYVNTDNKIARKKAQSNVIDALIEEMLSEPHLEVFKESAPLLAKEWFQIGADRTTKEKIRVYSYKLVGKLTQVFNLQGLDLVSTLPPKDNKLSSLESNAVPIKPSKVKSAPETMNLPESPKKVAKKAEELPSLESTEVPIKPTKVKRAPETNDLPELPKKVAKKAEESKQISKVVIESAPKQDDSLYVEIAARAGFKVVDLPTDPLVNSLPKDGEVDPFSGFRVLPITGLSPSASDSEDCVATHEVFVEDIASDKLLNGKKVHWGLSRNHVQTYIINSAITKPTNLEIRPEPSRGLLKQSSLPIKINRKLLERSSLGLPASLQKSTSQSSQNSPKSQKKHKKNQKAAFKF